MNRIKHHQFRKPEGWIDATARLKNTFPDGLFLNKVLFVDFYSLGQFGKTRLGTSVLYAKQSQNRELAKNIILEIKPLIEKILVKFRIDAVAFIPPSIPRNIQFIHQMAKSRVGQIIVAQKTLERLEQRIVNARDTIFVKDTTIPHKNIPLIDDAIGSGATPNETAKKLRKMLPAKSKIIGFAIVGSFKGLDVIREV